jgi:hypothetical protein
MSPVNPPSHGEPHSVGFNLAAIMLVVSMLALAGAYGLTAAGTALRPGPGANPDAPPLRLTLVGKELAIQPSWLPDAAAQKGDFSSRIELRIALPLGDDGAPAPVDVTLLPLSQARPSANLLDGVYLHQFMPNELSGPPGLVGKPLYATEGYENEEVWYDALSQDPFVAKCASPPGATGPAHCLRTVALPGGIAAVYGFDADALYAWRRFDPLMHTALTQIGAL